jgi:hypothetical protein
MSRGRIPQSYFSEVKMAGKADSEVKAMDAAWSALSPLEPDEQRRVLIWLIDKLKLSGSVSLGALSSGTPMTPKQPSATPTAGGSETELTPKQFMAQKKPKTDGERITCLAFYLTNYRQTQQFKTKDLTDLNTKEAAGPRFSNAAAAANNAMRDQYLAPAGGGQKQITIRGEALVNALPDREKVAAAMQEHPARRRKPSKARRRRSAK